MGVPKPRPLLIQPEDPTIRLIALTRGQVVIVDADCYEWAMKWLWYAQYCRCTHSYYAVRNNGPRKAKPSHFWLHRQLLDEPNGLVDHQNGNTLDCRFSNLRLATHSQSNANRRPQTNNSSGYSGVGWKKRDNRWQARIKVNQEQIHLGLFTSKLEAIKARLAAERQYYGEFAYSARPELMVAER